MSAPLPPGPRMPVALQTAIWSRRAQWLMSQCAARFGETLEIILRAVFGLERGERLEELRRELRRLLDLLTQPQMVLLPMLLGPERLARLRLFQRLHARVDELIYEEIAERRRASDRGAREDILSSPRRCGFGR